MSTGPHPASPPGLDRHLRRLVWALAGIIVVASAITYADKAADDRSAFMRWRPQIHLFWQGVNIYDRQMFPNPPIVPIVLSPLMALPPITGAMTWYGLKIVLTLISVLLCFRMVKAPDRPVPSWFLAGVLTFCLRPFLSDLHHGNNNLIILFLIVMVLEAWRRGHESLAGAILAFAIAFKVTPALFLVYFACKRSKRALAASFLGLAAFLLVVPALVLGPRFNGECLGMWWHRMLSPFLLEGASSPQEFNQSMVGVLTRLLTRTEVGDGRYDLHAAFHLVTWPPAVVRGLIKALSIGLVVLLVWFCRATRQAPGPRRLVGEFALVVLTMLFISERSWKHHFVTLLLPYAYLVAEFAYGTQRLRSRVLISVAVWGSVVLMGTTSPELAEPFLGDEGHELAQGYGMFLWAAGLLYVATAWRLVSTDRSARAAVPIPQSGGAGRHDAGQSGVARGRYPSRTASASA